MESLKVVAVVLLVTTPFLAVFALAVKFAGQGRPLNSVDYGKVPDPTALHHWVGNRLAMLPALSLLLGATAFRYPAFALVLFGLFVVLALLVATWIALGAERFQQGR